MRDEPSVLQKRILKLVLCKCRILDHWLRGPAESERQRGKMHRWLVSLHSRSFCELEPHKAVVAPLSQVPYPPVLTASHARIPQQPSNQATQLIEPAQPTRCRRTRSKWLLCFYCQYIPQWITLSHRYPATWHRSTSMPRAYRAYMTWDAWMSNARTAMQGIGLGKEFQSLRAPTLLSVLAVTRGKSIYPSFPTLPELYGTFSLAAMPSARSSEITFDNITWR